MTPDELSTHLYTLAARYHAPWSMSREDLLAWIEVRLADSAVRQAREANTDAEAAHQTGFDRDALRTRMATFRARADASMIRLPEPRYDEVFAEGVAALNAAEAPTAVEGAPRPVPGSLLAELQALAAEDDTPEAHDRYLDVLYTNHRGFTALRYVRPLRLWFGSTERHPTRQWLLTMATEKGVREFALGNILAFGERALVPETAR